VWRPAECDTSIRPGWFYHPADDAKVRSADDLVDLYHLSVGRNAKLLLNVPPTRDGRLHDIDVARLTAFRSQLNTLKDPNVSTGAESSWKVTGARTAELEMTLARPATVSAARMEEDITKGQLVARYSLLGADGGAWKTLLAGTTIGYARLQRFAPTQVRRLKLVIEDAIDVPEPVSLTV
jgi:alpha-L-fucosidase